MSNVATISAVFIIFAILSARLIRGINYKDCECGVADDLPGRKSLGAWSAIPRHFSWVVAVDYLRKNRYAGALINNIYVLTGSHCCRKALLIDVTVILSHNNKIVVREDSSRMAVTQIIKPDNYHCKKPPCAYDATLLKLRVPVKLVPKLLPICLPTSDPDDYNLLGTVAGWGKQPNIRYLGTILQQSRVQILRDQECKNEIGEYFNTDYHMCADSALGRSCKSGSGGILIYEFEPSKWTVIGVVSWEEGCEEQEVPSMYTKVVYFLDWIHKNTGDATFCEG